MLSHRSKAEAMQLGIPDAWHIGNGKADESAKLAARMVDMPSDLLAQHVQHRAAAERVASTVAAIQLRRLQARTRTDDGGALKERSCRQASLGGLGLRAKRGAAHLRLEEPVRGRRLGPSGRDTCCRCSLVLGLLSPPSARQCKLMLHRRLVSTTLWPKRRGHSRGHA